MALVSFRFSPHGNLPRFRAGGWSGHGLFDCRISGLEVCAYLASPTCAPTCVRTCVFDCRISGKPDMRVRPYFLSGAGAPDVWALGGPRGVERRKAPTGAGAAGCGEKMPAKHLRGGRLAITARAPLRGALRLAALHPDGANRPGYLRDLPMPAALFAARLG